ncbi:MAG: hypothetical protein WC615_18835 [Mucilaginibacter sp.]|jgi:hypothetical protein|uniref:hypothetical protein n=1 Tax=Mucilaginibacter sp. TaxID=1882438 RepID=UPI00356AAA03
MKKYLSAAILTIISAAALAQAPQQKGGINTVNNSMPSRISMNVTVARQTPNTSFGEKVNAGLSTAGSAIATGAAAVTTPAPGQSAYRERRTYTAGRKY